MKIYNKIVLDSLFNVVEEDSYEHDGEVALCKGGSPAPPPPTAEEIEITDLQIKLLKEEIERNKKMEPVLLEAAGLGVNADGTYYRLPEAVDELSELYKARSIKALKGEDGVSPALSRGIEAYKAETTQSLASRLGPDWEQTTAGQQALSSMASTGSLLEEEARRGAIGQGEGLLSNRQQLLQSLQNQQVSNIAGFSQAPTSEQFQSALNPFQLQRQAEFQGLVAKSQNKAATRSAQMGTAAAVIIAI